MIKFSIIVVVYNGEKYINNCIKNIKKQTYNDYEIIIVDDGSTDSTESIARKHDNDIRYYKVKHEGVSASRNTGISKARGKYFLFVDVDDLIEKDLLLMLDEVTKKDADLIKYGCKLVDEKNKEIGEYKSDKTELCDGQLAFETLCNSKVPFDMICVYLYNLKFWRHNKFAFAKGYYHEDFGLIPYMILVATKFISIDYSGYRYVQTNNSITRNDDYEKISKKAYDYLYHYDKLHDSVNKLDNINVNVKKIFYSYIANALLLKSVSLYGNDRSNYIKELKKRNVTDALLSNTILRKLKKLLAKVSISLYLKVIK